MKILRAFLLGLRDGWDQPIEVGYSYNVDHLYVQRRRGLDAYEWQDRGINVGQFLRAGRKSQPYVEKWWPFNIGR